MTEKTYTKEEIKEMLEKSQVAIERAILAIYALQTASEQDSFNTEELNGVGFSGADAGYLTYIAKYIEERKSFAKLGTILSGNHVDKARNRIMKYAGQLAKIANGTI